MKFGYARVSTIDQEEALQQDALEQYGCNQIFVEKASGAKIDRPVLNHLIDTRLRADDALVVWRLDRLGRSLKHLIEVVEALKAKGVTFVSITEGFDTGTPVGELVFHIFGAMAQFERNLIRERTQAGLAAARARGRVGGRKKALSDAMCQALARVALESKKSIGDLCIDAGISRATFYRRVQPCIDKLNAGDGKDQLDWVP